MIINAIPNKTIVIGRQGENLVRTVRFPIECYSVFGEGEFSLVHRRPTDDAAYPCVTTKDEDYLYWNITNADVQYSGNGSLQLTYTVGDHIAKSDVYITNTLKSLSQTENPPEAWKAWVDQINESVSNLEVRISELEDAVGILLNGTVE